MSFTVKFETLCVGDIVRTPKGSLAVVAQRTGGRGTPYPDNVQLSLTFPEERHGDHNSWWSKSDGLQLVCRWGGVKALCNIRAGKRKAKP
jgi:hypothetical protein